MISRDADVVRVGGSSAVRDVSGAQRETYAPRLTAANGAPCASAAPEPDSGGVAASVALPCDGGSGGVAASAAPEPDSGGAAASAAPQRDSGGAAASVALQGGSGGAHGEALSGLAGMSSTSNDEAVARIWAAMECMTITNAVEVDGERVDWVR